MRRNTISRIRIRRKATRIKDVLASRELTSNWPSRKWTSKSGHQALRKSYYGAVTPQGWSQEDRPVLTPSAIHPSMHFGSHKSGAVSSISITPVAVGIFRSRRSALMSSNPCSDTNQTSPERNRLLHRRCPKTRPDRAHRLRRQGHEEVHHRDYRHRRRHFRLR